jgi:predicted ATP-grasp superfamily ATP-dependent carboligase
VAPEHADNEVEIERRRDTLVSFDVRQIISLAALLTALISGLGYVMQLRNDTRDTALKLIDLNRQLDAHSVESKQRYEALTARVVDVERAKLLFCAARSADSPPANLPNIGC